MLEPLAGAGDEGGSRLGDPAEVLTFGRVRPMLAGTATSPFDHPAWLFEPKWDGYRAIAFLTNPPGNEASATGAGTRLQSRGLRDLGPDFPELGGLHTRLAARQAIIDGEIIALRDGRPDFQALRGGGGPAVYVAFDLLELEGRRLLDQPLIERRRLLTERLDSGPDLVHSSGVRGAGTDFHRGAVNRGLEGSVAKRLDSPYRPGRRTRDWLKVRNVRRIFAVVCGRTQATDARGVGALVLGALDADNRLVYIGRAGTGFGQREAAVLVELLGPPAPCPLTDRAPRLLRGQVVWVKPERVVEVEGLEWTREGYLRHPVYRGLRPDKDVTDCRAPARPAQ